jgi:Ca2+-transporting ATPase
MAAIGLAIFHAYSSQPEMARTMTFTFMAISPLMHAFNCRSRTHSAWQLGVFSNSRLWGSIIVGLGLQAMTIYIAPLNGVFATRAIGASDLTLVLGLAVILWVLGELEKIALRWWATRSAT